ncbi:putative membrane protein [Flavobacterium sp. CG_9.10]|uniref:hypothetical protein n=1 Tax=Flavobacterium sp. CG_9.10 TaxID=2787729 RepID=UPI0018CA94A3|nr:hypothetical protein [Flavobacterium sp. CG_9.10]MBG6111773.1 putative membrane protein [Flavobacterium sp. CG_9.10]
MSTNVPQPNPEDQELDLSQISKKIGGFFEKINALIFNGIRFFIKNAIVIVILLVVGVGIGLFLDQTQKSYDSQIIVTPNFGSTDYLYSKIDLIQSKINEGDTVFLKEVVGINRPMKLKKIEIKPINDVYKFIENKTENFELIKLMAEDGDIKKILEDNLTSKNYIFHTISLQTNGITNDKATIQPLLNFLNKSDYFAKIQKISIKNVEIKMSQNDTIISQINNVLNGFSNMVNGAQKSDKLVYYNENTQLNDIIKTKDNLINEQASHRVELVGLNKIVKDDSAVLNLESTSAINGKLKFVLPILFIFAFIVYYFFVSFYRKQKLKLQQ